MAGGHAKIASGIVFEQDAIMSSEQLTLKAYAKVNLTLEVIGKRDDGYHNVATILQTVDLADMVVINQADELSVECDQAELSGERNLAWKAAGA